jgi:hypothetical protein
MGGESHCFNMNRESCQPSAAVSARTQAQLISISSRRHSDPIVIQRIWLNHASKTRHRLAFCTDFYLDWVSSGATGVNTFSIHGFSFLDRAPETGTLNRIQLIFWILKFSHELQEDSFCNIHEYFGPWGVSACRATYWAVVNFSFVRRERPSALRCFSTLITCPNWPGRCFTAEEPAFRCPSLSNCHIEPV